MALQGCPRDTSPAVWTGSGFILLGLAPLSGGPLQPPGHPRLFPKAGAVLKPHQGEAPKGFSVGSLSGLREQPQGEEGVSERGQGSHSSACQDWAGSDKQFWRTRAAACGARVTQDLDDARDPDPPPWMTTVMGTDRPQTGRKSLQKTHLLKDYDAIIQTTLNLSSTLGKRTTQLKTWAKDLHRHPTKEDGRTAEKHVKRCATSYVIREAQIKTTMRYGYTPIRMSSTRYTDPSTCP